jgi:transcriptional regulator with XRE-family HTH domain
MPKNLPSRHYPQRSQWRAYIDQLLPSEDSSASEINVGWRLAALRKARGFSQRALADLSGLNFNTLSLIENDKTSPNVSTLAQLAEALHVPVTAFFEMPAYEQSALVYQKAKARSHTAFDHGSFADLGGGLTLGEATPLLMILEPHQDSGASPIVHTGQEFVYCLSGEMIYWVDGRTYGLEPGDSLIFDSHLPHRWSNSTDKEAQALVVICPGDQDDRSVSQHLPAEESE